MNLLTRCCMAAFVLLAFALPPAAMAADAPQYPWIRPDGSVDYQKLPRRPQPGDKLGYPKEQSAQMLPLEVRTFLDAVLRLYTEEGLFLDATKTYEVLGTRPRAMHMLERAHRNMGYTALFEPTGVFARAGWRGRLTYVRPAPQGPQGEARVVVQVEPGAECVDSKAVEGYLDLSLYPNLEQVPPVPPERWDRHGVFGRPFARALSPRTPGVLLFFGSGCLSGLEMGMAVFHEEKVR